MRCMKTVDAGAYVLGALSPAERAGYERHMAGCVECRDEVADLAVLPGLLGRLDAGTAVALADPPVQAPPGILTSTLNAARTERLRGRRRHRWQLAGTGLAAACLAVVLGLGVGTLVHGESSPPSTTSPVLAQMTPVNRDVPVIAMVGYTAGHGGTDVKLLCRYETAPPHGVVWTISLIAYPRDGGQSIPVTSWPVGPGYDDTANVFPGHIGLAPQDIARFEIVRADGTPLLWYKPS
jgi:Putative zinc-finger